MEKKDLIDDFIEIKLEEIRNYLNEIDYDESVCLIHMFNSPVGLEDDQQIWRVGALVMKEMTEIAIKKDRNNACFTITTH